MTLGTHQNERQRLLPSTSSCDCNIDQEVFSDSDDDSGCEIQCNDDAINRSQCMYQDMDYLSNEGLVGTQHQDQGNRESFALLFAKSSGPPQVLCLSLVYAIAMGSVVGVVPSVVTTSYARRHGLEWGVSCADYPMDEKPQECLDGSSDAQTSAAIDSFISNMLAFFTSSVVGSLSDEIGRRKIMIFSQFLTLLPSLCVILLQISDMNPFWYYATDSILGLVSWISIALSALADVIPKKWRAASFGLILSGFFLGFAFAPFLAVLLTHFGVSVLSFTLLAISFIFSVICLPETLPEESAERARRKRMELNAASGYASTSFGRVTRVLTRPLRDISILYRNNIFRLLSCLAFFSGMSTSGDQTLLLYYLQDWMNFNDNDVAVLFAILGVLGVLVQGVGLKHITELIGERMVIVVAFSFGSIHNIVYAFASSKVGIFIGASLGSVCDLSFPTISAIKSNNTDEHEQGKIQGALYSLSALARALGPPALRIVYSKTRESEYPGSFFLVATVFFAIATVCALLLPEEVNSAADVEDTNDHLEPTATGEKDDTATLETQSGSESLIERDSVDI